MPDKRKSYLRSRMLVRAATAVIAGLLIASGVAIWLLRQGAVADTQDENHRLGVVFAEQVTRSLQSVDLILQEIAEKISNSGAQDVSSLHDLVGGLDMHETLARRLFNLPQAEAVAILDANGYLINGSRQWPIPLLRLADRPYFHYGATTVDPNPFLSEPTVSAVSGSRTVYLIRRLTRPDGGFLGLIIAAIRLDYFTELFANAGFSAGENVTLARRDGEILLRYPAEGVQPGARFPPSSPWYKVVAAGGGFYRSGGAFPGLGSSYVSVHPLSLYPVVVDVLRVEGDALARWRGQASTVGIGALVATLSLALLLHALSRQIALIERSRDQITRQVIAIRGSEERLAAQTTMLETTLDHMNQGLVMVNASGRICICNRRAIELLDLPPEMMTSHPHMLDVLALLTSRGEFAVATDSPFDPAVALDSRATYERRRPNGTVIEVRTAPLADGGMVRTLTDVTARSVAEEMLGLAASHDQLTGVANRHGFHRSLEAALTAAQRTTTTLALLCLDLDRFKAVNDALGHNAGDQVLMIVSERMRGISRATDLIGRLGGDEFAVVLPGANLIGAEQMCERLLDVIRLPYDLGGYTARIGVSIGIAIFPNDGLSSQQLLINADTALYRAKAAGRNTWCAYISGDAEREHERMRLEQDFRTALERQEFTLAYQPICDSVTREPVAFEALCRWTHPARGDVSPTEFIPIAELTGLIIPLGRWVIEAACDEAAAWARPLCVAVNLSPAQFRDTGLLDCVRHSLQRSGLASSRLHLEVTEGLLLDDSEDTLNTMHALRQLGIRLVLDDFGVAHSNLGYLRGLPFDTVKIDRSFLRALNTDPQARALVEAILAMARALGIEVIGEGVETPEQLALLCHLQCRLVQGFHLGYPTSGAQTRDWIAKLVSEGNWQNRPQII